MKKMKKLLRRLSCSGTLLSVVVYSLPASGRDYFDPSLLSLGDGKSPVDLSQFSEAGDMAAGTYSVNVYINQRDMGIQDIVFRKDPTVGSIPDLTPAKLASFGVNIQAIPAFSTLPQDKPVNSLAALIPQATTRFNLTQLRLDISIPQIAMTPNVEGTVSPELWDEGVPALLVNYNLSAGRSETEWAGDRARFDSFFATARSGVNAGAWRVRSTATYSRTESSGFNTNTFSKTRFSNSYIERDLQALRSSLLVGESSTGGDVFDGVPLRGVMLRSNEQMLPSSLRGFAPVVNGVANSNARVSISQNGFIVYQTYVAPGPFRIADIYPSGMAGDLQVTITEADGSIRTSIIPYSALPVMLRAGGWKYELAAGRYDGGLTDGSREENFLLGTLIYGLPKDITLYGGALVSADYVSAAFGAGLSLREWGAFSADVTAASARLTETTRMMGESYRLRYSKSLLSTGTSVDLTALRYSTRDYYSFGDFNSLNYRLKDDQVPWSLDRRRSSFQTQISQQMGDKGSLNFRATREDFWGRNSTMTTLSLGYSGSAWGVSYGVNYSIDRVKGEGDWPENRQLSLNVNVPFSLFSPVAWSQNAYATTQLSRDNHGRMQSQLGLSGSGLDGALGYSVQQSSANQGQGNNSSVNLGYTGSKGYANAGYSYGAHSRTMNMSASGGLVGHAGGITLAPSLGSSVAIISAAGVSGIRTMNGSGLTDGNGYTVAPYLSDYSKNSVGLDPSSLPEDTELEQSNVNVYPTKGAVVMATFTPRIGYQVLMTLERAGTVVPFGATVSIKDDTQPGGRNASIVGDAGQVYLSGMPEKGTLLVKWGRAADNQCQVAFDLNRNKKVVGTPVRKAQGECR